MKPSFFDKIDWSRPWLAHVRVAGEAIALAEDWRAELNARAQAAGLQNHRGLPIRFVPQSALPDGVAYETHISETGCVPTRENLHDFFNALVWLTFPRVKIRLNALQSAEIQKSGATAHQHRGKVRDAATIFDENAVLLITPNSIIVDGLKAHRWTDVFIRDREIFRRDCTVFLFGHALMEKLVEPYKAITGHMWVVSEDVCTSLEPNAPFDLKLQVDRTVDAHLVDGLATTDFSHLPILGVPDWFAEQTQTFYEDRSVFRPRRQVDIDRAANK